MIRKLLNRIKLDHSFGFINKLKAEFPQAEVYLVGGIIRDEILERGSKDYDFVVRKVDPKDLNVFLKNHGWVSLVGKNFGVFKFKPENSNYELPFDIALPRTEISTGVAYRDFDVQSDPDLTIEEDLSRRDFTINSMALDIKNEKLIDPFGGINDIKKKIINTVGNPIDRFSEDYSRILRAIRFSSQLDFKISTRSWKEIKKLAPKILTKRTIAGRKQTIIPYEIISVEFLKSFAADPARSFDLYDKGGIFEILLPEIANMKGIKQPEEFHQEGDVFTHTKLCMDQIEIDAPIELVLGLLFHDIGKPPTMKTPEKDKVDRIRFDEHTDVGADLTNKICQRLKLSKKLSDHVVWLVRNHMLFVAGNVENMRTNTIKKYFIDDPRRGDNLLELYRIDVMSSHNKYQKKNIKRYREVYRYIKNTRRAFRESHVETFRHIISGDDIMKQYKLTPGPKVGKMLAKADEFIFKYITENKKEPNKKDIYEFISKSLKL